MKKFIYFSIILTIFTTTCLSVNAINFKFWQKKNDNAVVEIKNKQKDFEILPTMNSASYAKNQVWVGTFQLIWNDLINELIKHPVEFVGYKSIMAENLNKQDFTADELSESAYYKTWGLASPKMKKQIEQGIKEKFNETSDILDSFDWTPAERKYILYAMLKKDFEYLKPFDKLDDGIFTGSDGSVKYFGIDENSSSGLRSTIDVLFYNGQNNNAIKLVSKQNDVIYLYRTDDDKTLSDYYSDMQKKAKDYNGKKYFSRMDKFKAPMIDFKSEREFPEICNKLIKQTDYKISRALETVQFKMDETGIRLKSEAGMMQKATSIGPQKEMPRYFYYNNKYVIFLSEEGKKPYFAMKVTDAKKLQK